MRLRAHRVGLIAGLAALLCWSIPALGDTSPAGGDALYWRIHSGTQHKGYLLGTIHSEDPRVVDFPESLVGELTSCEVFAMEMVPDLATLKQLTEYLHYPENGVLERHLGAERYRRVMDALSGYQVPEDWKSRMKVWAVLMTLSVPPPETGFFMDLSLSLRAAGAGLRVAGLETLEQQLSFLEEMPLGYQLQLLDQALAEFRSVSETHREMVDTYLKGSLSALDALASSQFAELEAPVRRYFLAEGIIARNRRMLQSLLPLLKESRVFVAVGALHLPGDRGLIRLLRDEGYRLEPMSSPFVTSAASGGSGE